MGHDSDDERADSGPAEPLPYDEAEVFRQLTPEEERERAPREQEGEGRQIPTAVVVGLSLLFIGFVAIAYRFKPVRERWKNDTEIILIEGHDLVFESNPDGAEVLLDGESLGVTPLRLANPIPLDRNANGEAHLKGAADQRFRVQGARGQRIRLNFRSIEGEEE